MQEEGCTDNETLHTTETVSWLALEHGKSHLIRGLAAVSSHVYTAFFRMSIYLTDRVCAICYCGLAALQAPPHKVPNSHSQACNRRASTDDGHCIGCDASKPECSAGSGCLPKPAGAKGWKRYQTFGPSNINSIAKLKVSVALDNIRTWAHYAVPLYFVTAQVRI